jgi:hypothetical protein
VWSVIRPLYWLSSLHGNAKINHLFPCYIKVMIIIWAESEHNENDLLQSDSQSSNGTVFTVYFCFCFTEMRCCWVLFQPIKWPEADDSYRYTIHDSPHPFPFNNTDILLLNIPKERMSIANIKRTYNPTGNWW